MLDLVKDQWENVINEEDPAERGAQLGFFFLMLLIVIVGLPIILLMFVVWRIFYLIGLCITVKKRSH